MQEEIWKDVVGYENLYMVSNLGRIKSKSKVVKSHNKSGEYSFLTKPKILRQQDDGNGYLKVRILKGGVVKKKRVHRLVGYAFLSLKDNQVINHIDFNRKNNNVLNLECCTQLHNMTHSRINNRFPKVTHSDKQRRILKEVHSRKVYCIDTGSVYESIKQASELLGYAQSTLGHYLSGRRKNKTSLRYFTVEKSLES